MKKTIISLLALAGVAFGAQTVTFGSYYTVNNEKYDAVSAFAGKTKEEIKTLSGIDTGNIDHLAFDVEKIITLNPKDMLVSDASVTKDTVLTLTSLSVIGRRDSSYVADDSSLTLTVVNKDGSTTASYTTTIVTYNGYSNNNDHGLLTYTFNGSAPTFTLEDTLTFTFAISSERNSENKVPNDNKVPMATFVGLSAAPHIYTSNGKNWQGAFQITATIPEPTTATLSLLALAGLAARRRRR